MVFRIYLSNQIGAVGMGLYQMILSVYTFVATFATSGVTVAVSNLVSAHLAKREPSAAKYILRFCLILSIVLGLIAGGVLFFAADPISLFFIKEAKAAFSLRILSPGLVFMSLSACFRGYFLSISKVSKPAIAMILEQLSRMAIIIAFMAIWLPLGIEYACAAAVIGMTVSEMISALYLYIVYRKSRAPLTAPSPEVSHPKSKLINSVLKITIPVALSSYLQATLRLIENFLLPNSLKEYAKSDTDGLSVYGTLKGMAMPLLMFPSVFLSSLAVSLVPEVSRAVSVNDTESIHRTLNRVIKITLISAIMMMAVFFTFSHELSLTLYRNDEVCIMLKLLAPLCPFIYLEMVASGILRGLNEQLYSLKYNTVDSVMRILLILFIVPRHGLYGFIGIMYVSNIYTSLSSIKRLIKVTDISFRFKDWLLKPLSGGLISALFFKGVFRFLIPSGIPVWLSLAFSVLFLCIGYVFLLLIMGSITSSELKWIQSRFRFSLPQKRERKVNTPSVFK